MNPETIAKHAIHHHMEPVNTDRVGSLMHAIDAEIMKSFETETDQTMARTKFVLGQLTEYLGKLSSPFHWVVRNICRQTRTLHEDGKIYIPDIRDVLYNLVTYSHIAVERLKFSETYVKGWRTPDQVAMTDGQSYVVMLSVGYICPGVYDGIEKVMKLRMRDSELNIDPMRLLAIHSQIDDGLDFLRGVPMLTYEALEKITAGSELYVALKVNTVSTRTNSDRTKKRISNKRQKAARRNNRK